jgi:hypothetical protein
LDVIVKNYTEERKRERKKEADCVIHTERRLIYEALRDGYLSNGNTGGRLGYSMYRILFLKIAIKAALQKKKVLKQSQPAVQYDSTNAYFIFSDNKHSAKDVVG